MPTEIYLDHAATTRPLPPIVEAMARVHLDSFGNPSSSHAFAAAPREALADARELLRGTLGAARIILTSGGTEADLLGVTGAALARPPGRVLVGAADHPAVVKQVDLLARFHHRMVAVPVGPGGTIEPEALFELLGADVRVVAILHGHNELGGLAPVDELVGLIRKVSPSAHIHVDLVQSYGKVPFDLDARGVDSVAVSAHKLHGPRGVGFLALSSVARLEPLQIGGGQEEGLRGGTENVAGAVGLMLAAEQALSHLAANARAMVAATDLLLELLRQRLPRVARLGPERQRLPHVLSLRIPGVNGETLQQRCSARGLAFSIGSACHSGAKDNPVLAAIGMERRAAREVVRLSVSACTSEAEIRAAAAILTEEALAMQAVAPRGAR